MEKLKLNPSSHIDPAPGNNATDYAMTVAKVGSLAFPPFASGAALIDLLTAPLRGKRMSDWCERLRLSLNELSERIDGLTPESLVSSEAFISAFAQATTAAIKTHQKEKLEALRNALLNVAIGRSPADDLASVFLHLLDSLAPIHLAVLGAVRDHTNGQAFQDRYDVANAAVLELRERGLLRDTRPYVAQNRPWTVTPLVTLAWEATSFGEQFLKFTTSPEGMQS